MQIFSFGFCQVMWTILLTCWWRKPWALRAKTCAPWCRRSAMAAGHIWWWQTTKWQWQQYLVIYIYIWYLWYYMCFFSFKVQLWWKIKLQLGTSMFFFVDPALPSHFHQACIESVARSLRFTPSVANSTSIAACIENAWELLFLAGPLARSRIESPLGLMFDYISYVYTI